MFRLPISFGPGRSRPPRFCIAGVGFLHELGGPLILRGALDGQTVAGFLFAEAGKGAKTAFLIEYGAVLYAMGGEAPERGR